MSASMPDSMYHRAVGWRAPPLRRVLIATVIGVVVGGILMPLLQWELAVLGGWIACALAFLGPVGHLIISADGARTEQVAMVQDETRRTTIVIVVGACLASLLAVLFTLAAAGRVTGAPRLVLIGSATLTVGLSWILINTIFTLRYADLHYQAIDAGGDGIAFDERDRRPEYRDFAYVAFTIGMCYQVSDNSLRNRDLRRTVLVHAMLSYVYGVAIVAAGINLIAGLIQ